MSKIKATSIETLDGSFAVQVSALSDVVEVKPIKQKLFDLAAVGSKELVGGKQAKELVDNYTAAALINSHNRSGIAHPELTATVNAAAARAETAAQAALTNGKIYATKELGQADGTLGVDSYFWVASQGSETILELWKKGASTPTDTEKRMLDAEYIKEHGTEDLVSSFISFAVVGEDGSRTWLEADHNGKPTKESADMIMDALPFFEDVPFPTANSQGFAIIGEDGGRSWIEADKYGEPTDFTIEKLVEKLPSSPTVEDISRPDINKQGFAIVGEDNSRTWLEADIYGKPTEYAISTIAAGMPPLDTAYYLDYKNTKRRVVSGPNIVAWGDSMTIGATGIPYTDYLFNMLKADGKNVKITNRGVGGESSITIAARANATPFTAICTTGVMPASGKVPIKLLPINGVIPEPLKQSGHFACSFAGVHGVFGADVNGSTYDYWFNRLVGGASFVCNRPETIYLDISEETVEDIHIIWIGQNAPRWVTPTSDYARINERAISDTKAIIQHMATLNKRYLVITPPAGGAEKDVFDARWYDEFGQYYIPIRQYMTTPIYAGDGTTIISCYGLEDAGFIATPQDIIEIGERRIPLSLRNDGVHWKAQGYEVLAKLIYKKIKQLGWV
jgi:hypothetical protein